MFVFKILGGKIQWKLIIYIIMLSTTMCTIHCLTFTYILCEFRHVRRLSIDGHNRHNNNISLGYHRHRKVIYRGVLLKIWYTEKFRSAIVHSHDQNLLRIYEVIFSVKIHFLPAFLLEFLFSEHQYIQTS